jgi:uncharacterized protein (TIGR03435 family)
MTHALAGHLWQSTFFVLAAGLMTAAFRGNRAQVRYWLWLSASLKFLVPFALLLNLGSYLETWMPAGRQIAGPAVSQTIEQFSAPFFPDTLPSPNPAPDAIHWIPFGILAVWLAGFATVASIRFRGWLRIRAAVRASAAAGVSNTVEIRVSPVRLEPGVVGIVRPVLLLPEGIAERLTPSELETVLAHELCHVRRRDNLFAAIHMIVEAAFWFHPLVWWIGAHLVEERERACDEEVLSQGSHPEVYADAILNVCKLYAQSPLACVSGVSGASIRRRIEAIMADRRLPELNRAKKFLLAGAGTVALAGPIAIGLLIGAGNAPAIHAAPEAVISFEVTSVKRNNTDDPPRSIFPLGPGDVYVTNGGRFNATGLPLATFVYFAYKVLGNDGDAVKNQLPGWAMTDRYDIEARTDGDPPKDSKDQMRLMMRSLLADRFKLKTHYETRQVPVYAASLLKAGKTGPGLELHSVSETESPCVTVLSPGTQQQPTKPGPGTVTGGFPTQCGGLVGMAPSAPGRIRMGARNITLDFLAKQLPYMGQLGRPVLDRTGLTGTIDIVLEWVPDVSTGNGLVGQDFTADPNGPSFDQALKEQLGLKLDSQKGENQVLIIDHVERPSEN